MSSNDANVQARMMLSIWIAIVTFIVTTVLSLVMLHNQREAISIAKKSLQVAVEGRQR